MRKVTLDVTHLWPKDAEGRDVTIEVAAREMKMNPRSITTIKKGTERGSWDTLVKLREWLSRRLGRDIKFDDLLKIEGNDD